jgi:fucose 4-O-acetylase-like acetyltransferase
MDCVLDIWLRLQQVLFFVLVLHIERLDFEEFLNLLRKVDNQVVLKLLFHELSNGAFNLLVVSSNLFLVLVIIIEDFDKLSLRRVEGLLRQVHQVLGVVLVLAAANLNNEDAHG